MSDPAMDTPLAPIEAPEPASRRPDPGGARKRGRRGAKRRSRAQEMTLTPTFIGPWQTGVAFGLRAWHLVLAALVVHLVLALTVVMPFQSRMAERLDGHAHGPALAGEPDAYDRLVGWEQGGLAPDVWGDAKRLESSLLDGQKLTVFWIAIVAWLFGALCAGGYLGAARDGGKPTLAGWLGHGGAWFGRMLRVGLVFALAYYVLATLVLVLWANMGSVGEKWSPTSSTAWWAEFWRNAVMVAGFLWLRVVADLARADLVRTDRRSALLAFFRACGTTFRHPLRTLGLAVLIGLPAFGIVLGLGALLDGISTTGVGGLLLGFVVIELAVFVRLLARACVLAGSAQLLDDLAAHRA